MVNVELFVLRFQVWSQKSTEKSGDLILEKSGNLKWKMCRNPG